MALPPTWRQRKTGEAGLVAGDIIAYLGRALRQLEEATVKTSLNSVQVYDTNEQTPH